MPSLEEAIEMYNAEVLKRQNVETHNELLRTLLTELREENKVMRGQLCQCRLDAEITELA